MQIFFRTSRLQKQCARVSVMERSWGSARAKKIRLRLDALAAAETLEDLRHAPGRLHELTGNRKGQFAFDLDGPYRLIFEPADEPVPRKDDSGLDWSSIEAVTVLDVEDYHG